MGDKLLQALGKRSGIELIELSGSSFLGLSSALLEKRWSSVGESGDVAALGGASNPGRANIKTVFTEF